jgi:hypothetical protein
MGFLLYSRTKQPKVWFSEGTEETLGGAQVTEHLVERELLSGRVDCVSGVPQLCNDVEHAPGGGEEESVPCMVDWPLSQVVSSSVNGGPVSL